MDQWTDAIRSDVREPLKVPVGSEMLARLHRLLRPELKVRGVRIETLGEIAVPLSEAFRIEVRIEPGGIPQDLRAMLRHVFPELHVREEYLPFFTQDVIVLER